MSGNITPSGGSIRKLWMLGGAIIVLCIAGNMLRDTFFTVIVPMLPWIFGGVVLFFACVFIWNRLRQ